ncbi:MAG: hypothetical protein JWP97_2487 [Labilithrix sp.]|nr:hypothetical protein [Labilithrix sp.]
MGVLRNAIVLAVDDDADMRELLALVLTDFVREVVTADSVDSALRLLDCMRPTLLVSDLSMPDRDGYDLIRSVRADPSRRNLPAIALSAYSEDGCRDAALAAGFDMFVRKPLDVRHFVPVLEALLGG